MKKIMAMILCSAFVLTLAPSIVYGAETVSGGSVVSQNKANGEADEAIVSQNEASKESDAVETEEVDLIEDESNTADVEVISENRQAGVHPTVTLDANGGIFDNGSTTVNAEWDEKEWNGNSLKVGQILNGTVTQIQKLLLQIVSLGHFL